MRVAVTREAACVEVEAGAEQGKAWMEVAVTREWSSAWQTSVKASSERKAGVDRVRQAETQGEGGIVGNAEGRAEVGAEGAQRERGREASRRQSRSGTAGPRGQ